MTTFSRPGAYIQEAIAQQDIVQNVSSDAIAAIVGYLTKGPTTPTLISTWSEFTKYFGGLDYTLPTSVAAYQFFANGGRNVYIRRATQSGATAATITLKDAASSGNDTLTVTAKSTGTWANGSTTSGLWVEALAQGTSRFSLVVYGAPVSPGADSRSNILEQFTDLSVNSTDARYAQAVINATSSYITVTDLTTSSLRPYASGSIVALATGSDGSGGVTAAILGDIYVDFDNIDAPLIFNIPDAAYFTSTNWAVAYNALLVYADRRGDAFVVVDPIADQTVANVLTQTGTLTTSSNVNGAVYYPWLTIPDTTKSVRGVTATVPPGGAILGQYQATDASAGVFKAPAGYTNRIALAVGVQKRLTNSELDSLNSSVPAVNAIRVIPGTGIVVMGARTIANTSPNNYVNVRRNLIHIGKNLTQLSQFAVFENNDAFLWSRINTVLSNFLFHHWNQGGLRGSYPSQAFYVKCDETTTTAADIAAGRVNIQVGVALQYPAEFVVITIGQIAGNASVTQA